MVGNALWPDVHNLATDPVGKVGVEHAHVFLDLLLGVATKWLTTPDKNGLV